MPTDLTRNASQATQIEQVRAAAEVAAAIQVAQQFPRTPSQCLSEFLESCDHKELAERAFFRYSRGGESVTGVTIAFAQEAARCWTNMQSGSVELERRATESYMIAFAWDVEKNSRRSSTFVNPHQGYTDTPKFEDDGSPRPPRKLVAVRDIRENNASAASRLEREMILGVLPSWYIEAGKARCRETMAGDGAELPIEVRRQRMIDWFVDRLGVRRGQLEEKLGIRVDEWSPQDLAALGVIGKSIKAGEQTLDAEFPNSRGVVVGQDPEPNVGAAEAGTEVPKISKKDQNEIFAILGNAGIKGTRKDSDTKRHKIASVLLDRPVASFTELSRDDGVALLEVMRTWGEGADAQVAELLADDPPNGDTPTEQTDERPEPDGPDGDMAAQERGAP